MEIIYLLRKSFLVVCGGVFFFFGKGGQRVGVVGGIWLRILLGGWVLEFRDKPGEEHG